MIVRWGSARRLALVLALGAAALWVPLGAGDAAAQIPPGPAPCLVDRPCRLSVGLPGASSITYELAPNGERAVFVHREHGTLLTDLYSVTVAGTPDPVKIDSPAAKYGIESVAISPDGSRVVYAAQEEEQGPFAVYSVPIDGPASATVRLAGNVFGNSPMISPDGRSVVVESATLDRLLAVPIEGPAGAGVRLTDPLVAGGRILSFDMSANSRSVVYLADQDIAGVYELYRVPLTLSPPPDPVTRKLNAPLVTGRSVTDYDLAPNNGPVVYLADQDTDDVVELYSVRLGGAARVKLNQALPPGSNVVRQGRTEAQPTRRPGLILPDGSRVVYKVAHPDGTELHSVPIAGPASAGVRLDQPFAGAPDADAYAVWTSPDGAWALYTMFQGATSTDSHFWLFSVPAAGPASASTLLYWPSEDVPRPAISPDSAHVVHRFQLGTLVHLISVPIQGPASESVIIDGPENPNVPILIDAASTRALYTSQVTAGPERHLLSAPLSGDGPRYDLTETFVAGTGVDQNGIQLTPGSGSQRVVFRTSTTGEGYQLYSARLVPGIVDPPLP